VPRKTEKQTANNHITQTAEGADGNIEPSPEKGGRAKK
jgi:hypothetical protein